MTLNDLPKPFIIADVGSNWRRLQSSEHNLELALRHIDDAARCDASAVKFQFFTHRELYGFDGPSPYALPYEWLPILAARCAENSVEFMCSAFSAHGVLCVNPFVNIHKIASCEMKHLGILDAVITTGKPFLISTGAAHQDEIEGIEQYIHNRTSNFQFLECVASYPAAAEDYSLGVGQGLSDHTIDATTALVFAGAGATIFEKHFDALKGLSTVETPDTATSADPQLLKAYCAALKTAYAITKPKLKHFRASEEEIVARYRRRLKIINPVKAGDILRLEENFGPYRSLTIDRRAAGPESAAQFDGKKVKRDMSVAEGLWFDDVEA